MDTPLPAAAAQVRAAAHEKGPAVGKETWETRVGQCLTGGPILQTCVGAMLEEPQPVRSPCGVGQGVAMKENQRQSL